MLSTSEGVVSIIDILIVDDLFIFVITLVYNDSIVIVPDELAIEYLRSYQSLLFS